MWKLAVTTAAALLLTATRASAQSGADLPSYQAHIAAAEKSLRLGEALELRRWLDAAPTPHRGWEWRYLNAVSDTSTRAIAAPDTPTRLAISPSGDRLATVEDSRVRLWSWPGLEPLGTIEGHTDAIYRAEFDPTGARLITVSRDVTSRTWDIATGAEIARIELSNPAVAAATFSPDGTTAATCAWERDEEGVHGVVWVWDAATGDQISKARVGVKPLSAICFTPTGQRILVGSWDGLVHVLDAQGEEVRRITLPDRGIYNAVNDIAVSPDGTLVAAGTKDRSASVFLVESGELVATLAGHDGFVEGVQFASDGSTLATASADGTARLWRTADWSSGPTLRGHLSTVRGLVFADDAMVTCSLDGTLRAWDRQAGGRERVEIVAGLEGTYSATFNADGSTIALACHDGTLRVFNTADGSPVASWEAHPGSTCHAAAYSADGTRLITSSWDNTARVWRSPSHEPLAVLDAGEGVYAATLSPDGHTAATTGDTLRLWHVDSAEVLHRIAVQDASPRRACFSPAGGTVACGWSDGRARVYAVSTGAELAVLDSGGKAVETVAFDAEGEHLFTGDSAGVVRGFEASTWQELWSCDTGEAGVNQVAVMDGRIAAGTDRLVLLDAASGGMVFQTRPVSDTVWHLSWSPDGSKLGVCTTGGVAAVLTAPAAPVDR